MSVEIFSIRCYRTHLQDFPAKEEIHFAALECQPQYNTILEWASEKGLRAMRLGSRFRKCMSNTSCQMISEIYLSFVASCQMMTIAATCMAFTSMTASVFGEELARQHTELVQHGYLSRKFVKQCFLQHTSWAFGQASVL